MRRFAAYHSKQCVWTDDLGFMCQVYYLIPSHIQQYDIVDFVHECLIYTVVPTKATALFLGRNVHLVGTANVDPNNPGYTRYLEILPLKHD